MRINLSEQNKKNDQEYFISGISEKDGVSTNIEGSLKIDKYKDAKKTSKMFGTYEIAEQPNGKTSGLYKGNFIFSFKWDPKTQEITDQKIELKGNWENYTTKETQTTELINN